MSTVPGAGCGLETGVGTSPQAPNTRLPEEDAQRTSDAALSVPQ